MPPEQAPGYPWPPGHENGIPPPDGDPPIQDFLHRSMGDIQSIEQRLSGVCGRE